MLKRLATVFICTSASLTLFAGCFGDDEVTATNPTLSNTQALAGTDSLDDAMARLMGNSYTYGEEDLSTLGHAQSAYDEALKNNPNNSTAKFGSALTEVLLAAQNPKVADLINRTVEAPSPFDSRIVEEAPSNRVVLMKKAARLAETFPAFHEVQDALESEMLPALEHAIAKLTDVYQDDAFSLKLTVDGETREIGRSEAGVLLGGLKALHGLLTLFLSYDLDFDHNGSYTYLDDLSTIGGIEDFDLLNSQQEAALQKVADLLEPGSSFLAVRPKWRDRLAKVDDEIADAIKTVRDALASIPARQDVQGDDLLRICSGSNSFDDDFPAGCIDGDAYSDALAGLDSASKYMKQPLTIDIPDLDTAVTVQISAYFNVQDYKKLLPHYGFYAQNEWSRTKPFFYFSDATGKVTGNLNTLEDLTTAFDNREITAVELVDALRDIIHFQDPTFQGVLVNGTEAKIWDLYHRAAVQEDQRRQDDVLFKRGAAVMRPSFILDLTLR